MSEELYTAVCADCGILYGFDKRIEAQWRKSHKAFVCPNGHRLAFNKIEDSPEEKIKTLEAEISKLTGDLKAANATIADLQLELEIWKPSSIDKK